MVRSPTQLGWLQNGCAVLSAPGQEWLHRGLSCPKSARLGLRRHLGGAGGRHVTGGILIANPAAYDALSHRFLFGSLFGPIVANIVTIANAKHPINPLGS